MFVFSEKLDSLPKTVGLQSALSFGSLVPAMRNGLGRSAIAIGSGGSAIAAEYFAVCRRTLGAAPTLVQTPLEFILLSEKLADIDVWVFSAGGSNPDILAVIQALATRRHGSISVVTGDRTSLLAKAARSLEATIHFVTTAEQKDGFLATHSLVGAIQSMLLAADAIPPGERNRDLHAYFSAAVAKQLDAQAREQTAASFQHLSSDDALFVLFDPRLAPMAKLIETSVWEAALCAVQATDFRSFAHGRHVWLGKRPGRTTVLALTGAGSRSIWADIEGVLPADIRRHVVDAGNCGRLQNAIGVVTGLCVVEALGKAVAIDPGRPGIATFSRSLYEARSLLNVALRDNTALHHKADTVRLHDDPALGELDLEEAQQEVLAKLASRTFRGMVVDYDGTVVTREGRFDPPGAELIGEINRLCEEGLSLAVATGRGGSAGETLRAVLPSRTGDILVSYYNGAHTRLLEVDIGDDKPKTDSRLDVARRWLRACEGFRGSRKFRDSGVQLTVDLDALADPASFIDAFKREMDGAEVRMVVSGHTLDICLNETCKTGVAHLLATRLGCGVDEILCIGDSGGRGGNDYSLLGLPFGISVDAVCDRPNVCWSLFGDRLTGPAALISILRALRRVPTGGHRLHLDLLAKPR